MASPNCTQFSKQAGEMLHRLEGLAARVTDEKDAEAIRWAVARLDQFQAAAPPPRFPRSRANA
jgi:hypothetical protein